MLHHSFRWWLFDAYRVWRQQR